MAGLSGFMAQRGVTTAPTWIQTVVVNNLYSKTPLVVYHAAIAANELGINCPNDLMAVYKAVHNTFGSHEDMIKTAILGALRVQYDPYKQSFLLNVLTNDNFPILSSSFSALLNAIETAKSRIFLPKINVYSDSLKSLASRLQSAKEKSYQLQECLAMQNKVNNLRKELGGN